MASPLKGCHSTFLLVLKPHLVPIVPIEGNTSKLGFVDILRSTQWQYCVRYELWRMFRSAVCHASDIFLVWFLLDQDKFVYSVTTVRSREGGRCRQHPREHAASQINIGVICFVRWIESPSMGLSRGGCPEYDRCVSPPQCKGRLSCSCTADNFL